MALSGWRLSRSLRHSGFGLAHLGDEGWAPVAGCIVNSGTSLRLTGFAGRTPLWSHSNVARSVTRRETARRAARLPAPDKNGPWEGRHLAFPACASALPFKGSVCRRLGRQDAFPPRGPSSAKFSTAHPPKRALWCDRGGTRPPPGPAPCSRKSASTPKTRPARRSENPPSVQLKVVARAWPE